VTSSFNGAVDKRRRRVAAAATIAERRARFNGAVDKRRRRDAPTSAELHRLHASMGPSTSVDGEPQPTTSGTSRSFCFNGAVDKRRRRVGCGVGGALPVGGFNGAVDKRRRRGPLHKIRWHPRGRASMGPSTSVDGEHVARVGGARRGARASMGPSTSVDGERAIHRLDLAPPPRFNGAVDKRRRRALAMSAAADASAGFNGAVDKRRRRVSPHARKEWEPHGFNGAVDKRRRRVGGDSK